MPIIIVSITVLLALCGLVTFIVVDINKEPKNILEECSDAHEGYNLTSQSFLGVFSQFAVAADNKHCSTIGRCFFLKIIDIINSDIDNYRLILKGIC